MTEIEEALEHFEKGNKNLLGLWATFTLGKNLTLEVRRLQSQVEGMRAYVEKAVAWMREEHEHEELQGDKSIGHECNERCGDAPGIIDEGYKILDGIPSPTTPERESARESRDGDFDIDADKELHD